MLAGAGSLLAQAPDTGAVVRLSYVQGPVSILQGETTQFDQAQANMPLLAGYTLSTGENGQAEVEFTDGSVARLTPQSQLRLVRLPGANARDGVTEMEMLSGLGYFELNTADGQRYEVHFAGTVAQPTENSIFRIDLDNAPDLSVFAGSVHASAGGGFDKTVGEGNSMHFDKEDLSSVAEASNVPSNSWDQWNQDRDSQIASQAQQQTSAREMSGATNEPGWDDLDSYGDWYPVEGYGNVWTPSNVPAGWDPYSSGYWANYPGWGYTWISAYPWGWLPYHCGAWNYWDSLGWGWVPGQCGLGWQPRVAIWNAPRGWREPPRPIPGGHIGVPTTDKRLLAVNRGPALPTGGGHMTNNHTRPVRIDGQRVDPLPVVQNPTLGGRFSYRGTGGTGVRPMPLGGGSNNGYIGNRGVGVGVPAPGAGGTRPGTPVSRPGTPVTQPGTPATRPGTSLPPRPVFRPAPMPQQPSRPVMAPAPRVSPPPPRMSAPAPRMSAPPPRMSAPPPSAPHPSAPAPAGHH
jgi:hypothetical protein